jgi:hypothetical protein
MLVLVRIDSVTSISYTKTMIASRVSSNHPSKYKSSHNHVQI